MDKPIYSKMPAATQSPLTPSSGAVLTATEAKSTAMELRKLPGREWDGKRIRALAQYVAMRFSEMYPNPWAAQDATTVARVESLMGVPYNKLEFDDAIHRRVLGTQRLKASLSSIPFYANRAAKAAQEGKEWDYWRGLWMSHVNMIHPPVASSTGEAT